MIQRTAGRACLVTENLLRFARPAADRAEPLPLSEIVGDALRLAGPEAQKREVVLRAGPAPAGDPTVPAALLQVLLNLVVNAIQASPPGGEVEVSTAADAGAVTVVVEDRGPGVPAELADRIFDPFFTTKPPAEGTGPGRTVSYGIVERLGGALRFAPRPGGGARFTVEVLR